MIKQQQQQQYKLKLSIKCGQNDNTNHDNQLLSGSSSANTSVSLNGSITSNMTQTSSTITSNLITDKSLINDNLMGFKETIDRLSQIIFEFLKQGLKPLSLDLILNSISQNHSLNMQKKSPPESPISFFQQQIESNSLTITFSQYSQIWNLIEHTMNLNFLNENNQYLFLPKDAYLAMFQEINRYANNINHTYLIDSRTNTSQLRRKHHFMVLLIGLKYKFQLFLMYLLW